MSKIAVRIWIGNSAALLILMVLLAWGVKEVYTDFYVTQAYDLAKQSEKFKKDPTDLKAADISKFKYLCGESRFISVVSYQTDDELTDAVKTMCNGLRSLQLQ